jgi:hypothetical protein
MTSPRSGQSRPVNVNARLPWPLLLFFVLACAGSWTCWNVAAAAAPASPRVAEAFDLVGSYGPRSPPWS